MSVDFKKALEVEALVTVPEAMPKRIGKFEVTDGGVYVLGANDEGEETRRWVFPYLEILALGRDSDSENWSKLLRFKNADGELRDWIMPMPMLAGGGTPIREILLGKGYDAPHIGRNSANDPLLSYLYEQVANRYRTVSRVGWHGEAFVLPDRAFGGGSEIITYLAPDGSDHAFRTAGDLEGWKRTLGALCTGNSRLQFAVSVALAAPLLNTVGEQGGGFHLRGTTSKGKTTTLEVAASVWGGSINGAGGYVQSWRGTVNGLEAVTAGHNDALLCLDELGQCDPKDAGEAAYMLANGLGKSRAGRSGGARRKASWRVLFLSTGELSLRDHAQAAGKRTHGGQEIRMAEIPFEVGEFGAFEDLHGAASADAFARQLKDASRQYYGTPIRAFLEWLSGQDPKEVASNIKALREAFMADLVPADASGEVSRVAGRFALVGAAGEMAIDAGILPWPQGEAFKAAEVCFAAWLATRNTIGASDTEQGIAQVRKFLIANGSSRFVKLDGERDDGTPRLVINRAGFREDAVEGATYFILTDVWRDEVCKGFNAAAIARALAEQGHLQRGSEDRPTVQRRFPEIGRTRVYAIRSSIFEGGDAC
ncbi:hypothetical protein D3C86_979510 [compost metagenome]